MIEKCPTCGWPLERHNSIPPEIRVQELFVCSNEHGKLFWEWNKVPAVDGTAVEGLSINNGEIWKLVIPRAFRPEEFKL